MHARVSRNAASGALPVVFVHGFGISGGYFMPAAERLASYFSVYIPDLPGHGKSDTPPDPLDVEGLAQALIQWMDASHLPRVMLVGHSMGCQVAIEAALRHPDRIDRLVLIGLTPDPSARTVGQQVGRLLRGGAHEHPAINRYLVPDYLRMGKRLIPEFQAMLRDPIETKLPRLRAPVMLVRGEKDPVVPAAWFEEAARLLGEPRTAVIPKWGHAVQYSAPEQLLGAIRPFLVETFRPAPPPPVLTVSVNRQDALH